MSFLLMVFLTLVCLLPSWWPAVWGGTQESLFATALIVLVIGTHAFTVSWWVSRSLAPHPGRRDEILARYDRWRFYHQLGQVTLFVASLLLLGWGKAVQERWVWLGGATAPGTELILLSPFLLGQILTWVFFYDADRA